MNKTLVGVVIGLLVVIVALQTYLLLRDGKSSEVSISTSTVMSDVRPVTAPTANEGRPRTEVYRDSDNFFELSYDPLVFTKEIKEGYRQIPGQSQQKIAQVTFVRYASHPEYNAAGFQTQERTDNPRMRIDVIPVAYSIYEAYLYETFDQQTMRAVTIAGRKGIRYWIGSEGEGLATYCIPMNNKTLCMSYTTLDGDFLRDYLKVPDFISLAQQHILAESVMNSIRFIK